MPKQKTKTAIEKRFKITKTGKMIRRHQGARHLRAAKSRSRIRRMKEPKVLHKSFAKKFKKLIYT